LHIAIVKEMPKTTWGYKKGYLPSKVGSIFIDLFTGRYYPLYIKLLILVEREKRKGGVKGTTTRTTEGKDARGANQSMKLKI